MRPAIRSVALGLALALSTVGCAGYCPIRWPSREIWAPSPSSPSPIQPPSVKTTDYPQQSQQDRITVAVEFVSRPRAQELFHADLLRSRIQPLIVLIENHSSDAYAFNKSSVGAQYVPASRVASHAYEYPLVTAARFIKWMVFIIPGLVFESVIEPLSTFDFPNMEDAARRPSVPRRREIATEFARHELADAVIEPEHVHAGYLFIHPPKLGSILPVVLVNMRTHQPRVFEVPTPPPTYTDHRTYQRSMSVVWDAVVKTINGIDSWHAISTDPSRGVIRVKQGWTVGWWRIAIPMTIALQPAKDNHTQVTLISALRGTDSAAYGTHSQTVDRFFSELDRLFPAPTQPKQLTTPASPVASGGARREAQPSSEVPHARTPGESEQ